MRDRLVFRQREKPFSNYELEIMENYFLLNSAQIQQTEDTSLLSLETIHRWGAEVGNSLLKSKTAPKEAEVSKVENDELQTYREIFANHPTFKSTPCLI